MWDPDQDIHMGGNLKTEFTVQAKVANFFLQAWRQLGSKTWISDILLTELSRMLYKEPIGNDEERPNSTLSAITLKQISWKLEIQTIKMSPENTKCT